MERLVFNTAEHKLEELEKYGFEKIPTHDVFNREIRNRYMYVYTTLSSNFGIIIYSNDVNIYMLSKIDHIEEKIFSVLFDLIKDGLVVKEKKDERSHCN